jgi:GNAT superfamily N-acetyltransferase
VRRNRLPPGLVFRRLKPSDSTLELTWLIRRAYRRLANLGLRFLGTHQGEEVTRRRVSKGECWVGALRGRLLATATLFINRPSRGCLTYSFPGVAWFGQFAVEPELQGSGIGTALLERIEARAKERGAREIACDTAEPARHLVDWYVRLGFRPVESVRYSDVNYRSVILSKAL